MVLNDYIKGFDMANIHVKYKAASERLSTVIAEMVSEGISNDLLQVMLLEAVEKLNNRGFIRDLEKQSWQQHLNNIKPEQVVQKHWTYDEFKKFKGLPDYFLQPLKSSYNDNMTLQWTYYPKDKSNDK